VLTGFVSDDDLVALYNLCKLFVLPSLDEGFGLPALEAMRCGAPVVGSNRASIPEVIGLSDALFNPASPDDVTKKLNQALTDPRFRAYLREHSQRQACKFSWRLTARRALQAFEGQHARAREKYSARKSTGAKSQLALALDHQLALQRELAKAVAGVRAPVPATQGDLIQTALAISENSPTIGQRQLLVDISTLVRIDSKSGIQRVVRSLLDEFLTRAPEGFRVEPVYRAPIGYRYAHRFVAKFLDVDMRMDDVPVEVDNGDIFLGLDLDAEMDAASVLWLCHHRRRGLKVYYVIYDLLAVLHPQWFPRELADAVGHWLQKIVEFADGFACISHSVARELEDWLEKKLPQRWNPINIGYFHLGANIESSRPSSGVSDEDAHVLHSIAKQVSLLMVGTVEPRKGHAQVLFAMEQLWRKGANLQLVIVGKPGWLVKPLIKRIRNHPELGRCLFWFEQVSDEALLKLYEGSSALLAASEGEGFGLPLIEAAQHGLPIIARDLPVFHEIAGEHAFYFDSISSDSLAEKLGEWFTYYTDESHPCSTEIQCLTWRESAVQLQSLLIRANWLATLKPGKRPEDDDDSYKVNVPVALTN
jgi:glycosyltransferase involved in cell wall biosynthesis